MSKIKKGFISVEYVIVGAIVFFAFTVFAMAFAGGNTGRIDIIRGNLDENNPLLNGVLSPPESAPGCFTMLLSETITGYDDACGVDVVIPSRIDGQQVKAIGVGAFEGKSLRKIKLPEGIEVIGANAFRNNLIETVIIPNSVVMIDDFSFADNTITNVYIPPTVRDIGLGVMNNNLLPDSQAFIFGQKYGDIDKSRIISYGGANKNVIIPHGITSIAHYAFQGTGIRTVILPSTVIGIEDYAFAYNELHSVTYTGTPPFFVSPNAFIGNPELFNAQQVFLRG